VGLCICLLFGIGLIGSVIISLVVDATHKFEEAAKIGFGLCACSLIALVTVSTVFLCRYIQIMKTKLPSVYFSFQSH